MHKTIRTSSNAHIPSSIKCSTVTTQLEASTEYKKLLPKRVSHEHNRKPGWKTSGKYACNVAKHNSESEVTSLRYSVIATLQVGESEGSKLLPNCSPLIGRQAIETPRKEVYNLAFFPQSLRSQPRQHKPCQTIAKALPPAPPQLLLQPQKRSQGQVTIQFILYKF